MGVFNEVKDVHVILLAKLVKFLIKDFLLLIYLPQVLSISSEALKDVLPIVCSKWCVKKRGHHIAELVSPGFLHEGIHLGPVILSGVHEEVVLSD